jgi:hypothetical protein
MKITGSFKFDEGDFQDKLIAAAERDFREKLQAKGIRNVTVKIDAATKKVLFSGPADAVEEAKKLFAKRSSADRQFPFPRPRSKERFLMPRDGKNIRR